jgi:hypothetical protein
MLGVARILETFMPASRLTLLATDACTLCEKAFDLLASMPELQGAGLDVVDIADHEQLLETFGERLPVLACRDQSGAIGQPLDWPFDAAMVSRWLRNLEQ